MTGDNLLNIIKNLKKEYQQLKEFEYIYPDDRKYIQKGNYIKYVNIKKLNKPKTGIITNVTINKIFLKSTNSNITWSINFVDNYIFYKFDKDYLVDAINELIEKNENKM